MDDDKKHREAAATPPSDEDRAKKASPPRTRGLPGPSASEFSFERSNLAAVPDNPERDIVLPPCGTCPDQDDCFGAGYCKKQNRRR